MAVGCLLKRLFIHENILFVVDVALVAEVAFIWLGHLLSLDLLHLCPPIIVPPHLFLLLPPFLLFRSLFGSPHCIIIGLGARIVHGSGVGGVCAIGADVEIFILKNNSLSLRSALLPIPVVIYLLLHGVIRLLLRLPLILIPIIHAASEVAALLIAVTLPGLFCAASGS